MDPELRAGNSRRTDFREANELPSIEHVRTLDSITITPEMYERMYLSPQNRVTGDLRTTFGNPTPIGLGGFLIAYCPIIFSILGWRGYGPGHGAATIGTYYFSGGLLAIFTMVFEFLLGNSFPATFFGVFGAFFLSYGATLTPSFYAYLSYDPNSPAKAVEAPGFLTGLGYWNVLMGIFTVYCTICASRVNALFFTAFLFLSLTFFLVGTAYLYDGEGVKTSLAHTLQHAGGATGMVTMVIGWYLLLAMMLSTVDFPFNLPVFDTSHLIPSGSDMRKRKQKKERGNGVTNGNGNDVEKQE